MPRVSEAFFFTVTICVLFEICYSLRIMVVRMRSTRSHTGNRRSHHALKNPEMAVCKNCGAYHRPHHMCLECGFYKGRVVIDLKAQKQAREERLQTKRSMREAEANQAANEPEALAAQDTDEIKDSTADNKVTTETPEDKK